MLANDSTTLAVEVPIWIATETIRELEQEHDIRLLPEDAEPNTSITGRIDFLQVRNGAVHILDYKPDARTNRPIAQLTIYALALTKLISGLKLFDIKCTWFNEDEYCEFFPRTLFAPRKVQSRSRHVGKKILCDLTKTAQQSQERIF
jgi:PD-(D/E)XK nuclease superfamily